MVSLSIITINYNNLDGLKKTYDSIMSQTFRDFEWIVIDGGSTDGSREFIEGHKEHFTFWCSEPDNGVYHAMNKGIGKAHGDYLNFMNSGDSFHDTRVLANVVQSLGRADVLYGDCHCLGTLEGERNVYPDALSLGFLSKMALNHQSCFFKTGLLKPGGYREDLQIVSDWYSTLMWFLSGKIFHHLDLIVADYDMRGISATNDSLMKREWEQVLNEVMLQYLPLFRTEMTRMQRILECYDCYEHQEVARLIRRGHFRKYFLTHFLKCIATFDRLFGSYH